MRTEDECVEVRNGRHAKMSIKICTLVGECDCQSDTCCFDGGWKADNGRAAWVN